MAFSISAMFFTQPHTVDSGKLSACATDAMLEPGSFALWVIECFSVVVRHSRFLMVYCLGSKQQKKYVYLPSTLLEITVLVLSLSHYLQDRSSHLGLDWIHVFELCQTHKHTHRLCGLVLESSVQGIPPR